MIGKAKDTKTNIKPTLHKKINKAMNELFNQATTLAKRYITEDFKKKNWWDHQILNGDKEFMDFVATYSSEYLGEAEGHFQQEYEASNAKTKLSQDAMFRASLVGFVFVVIETWNIANTIFINLAIFVMLVIVVVFYVQSRVSQHQAKINSQARFVCAMAKINKDGAEERA